MPTAQNLFEGNGWWQEGTGTPPPQCPLGCGPGLLCPQAADKSLCVPGAIAGGWVQLKPPPHETEGWGVWLHSTTEAPTARRERSTGPRDCLVSCQGPKVTLKFRRQAFLTPAHCIQHSERYQGVAFNPIKLFFMGDVKVTQVETLSKAPVRLFEKQ